LHGEFSGGKVGGCEVSPSYESTAYQLRDRITALIPSQPQILKLTSCWDLFKVPGFDCQDLQPSMAQAASALRAAQEMHLAIEAESKS